MHSKLLFQLLCTLAVAQMLSLSTTFCQKKKKKTYRKALRAGHPTFLRNQAEELVHFSYPT